MKAFSFSFFFFLAAVLGKSGFEKFQVNKPCMVCLLFTFCVVKYQKKKKKSAAGVARKQSNFRK